MLAVEGLTQLSVDGRVLPRIAEKWIWENDGHRLRVYLRRNVVFHDGTPLSPEVVSKVLRSIVSRPRNLALYPSLSDVTSISADGPEQIVIDLATRSAFLPEDLSVGLEMRDGTVGTGPYRVAKMSPTQFELAAFDRYYLGHPSIQQVNIRTFDALRTTWASLLRGEVDMVTEIPPESIEFLRNSEVQTISFPHWYQFVLAFNSSRQPFTSSDVRRALNIGTNREALIKNALRGYGTASTGPVWPKHWAYDETVRGFSFDRMAAVALLESAGFRQGAAAHRNSFPKARLRFTCLIPAKFSVLERLALELQRQMYDIGVDMQFEAVPIADYDARIRDRNFEAVLVDMISGPTLGRPYIFWRSAKAYQGLNVFGYENAEAERMFETLRTSTSEAAVRSATGRLQRVMLDDPPAIFIAWNERARVVRRDFNVYQEPGRDPISSLWRWTTNIGSRQFETASVQ